MTTGEWIDWFINSLQHCIERDGESGIPVRIEAGGLRRQDLVGGSISGTDGSFHQTVHHRRRLRTGPMDRADRLPQRGAVLSQRAGREMALRQWNGDPFTPRTVGSTVYGRGACDMKAGLVANLAALAAIRASGARLRGRVAAHFVVSEEDGGLGAFATLQRGHRGDACVITEPTGGALVTANAGALTFRIEVPGQATHASTRDAGFSALDAYLPIHRALARLETLRNSSPDPLMAGYPIPYALSVGVLRAGDWASSVPDRLVAEGRLGVRLGEDPAEAVAQFEACVAQTCLDDPWLRDHPAIVTWPGGRFAGGRLPAGHPLAALVRDAHTDAVGGPRPAEHGAPYGSDLRLYAAADIPTLQFGPGDVRVAHSPQEQVSIPEIVDVARTLLLAVLRAAGTR